ncbi:hypothetical protein BTO01_08535 [Vibrio jasicida]|uniref:hypothetical protein n=1 Tax=Vibrio jasicida TaxID=766224 RepID=UPI000CF37E4D|nr:hypothetical protein [Vibrio jasicida]PQJ71320.1 hypothetical protein BTO01_08535 [Vibrio jasicida]
MNLNEKVTLENLPCLIEVKEIQRPKRYIFFTCLAWIGIITAFIGLLTVFIGPDKIYYDRTSGPTFSQFVQLYPGPIASIGFVLYQIFNSIVNKEEEKYLIKLNSQLNNMIDIPDDEIPKGYELNLNTTENEFVYRCSLKLKQEPNSQQTEV